MAEGLKIIIGADVGNAVAGLSTFNKKLGDTDDIVSDVIKGSSNLEDALDKLAKQGLLSINSLQGSINDFKAAFASATNTDDAKKYGDALKVLQERQKQLIDSGLRVSDSEEKIGKAHSANVQATTRLSSSFLGLSKIFNVLPAEAQHLTHSFEGIVQSFERISHGTEGTAEKVTKFAGALGQVGLGLAISVAAGLLVGFVTELLHADAALEKATEESIRFSKAISDIDSSIADSKANMKFLLELSDINVDINFGKGFKGDLLKARTDMVSLQETSFDLGVQLEKARAIADEAFKSMQEGITDAGRAATAAFPLMAHIPDEAIKGLKEADKKLIENAKKTGLEFIKVQDLIGKNEEEQRIRAAKIRLLKTDEQRKQEKEANDALRALLESRANIVKEFTAKFASIKDPFPDFFTKNLPLGKVEDKALRSALENAFKVLETASRDLFNTQKIDAGTVPLEIKFQPGIIGKSDLVRAIEDKFGEVKKEIEDGINKGIINVPIDFRLPSEGNGLALKHLEDLKNDLAKAIEGLTGQKDAVLDLNFDVNNLTESRIKKLLEDLRQRIAEQVTGTPITASVDANFEIKAKVDFKRLNTELKTKIADALNELQTSLATSIGESLGNALSGLGGAQDAFAGIMNFLSDGIKQVGIALIKIGLLSEGIQKALASLSVQPELALALGIAFVALSQILKNNFKAVAAREAGGPVTKGLLYLVNEKGSEIFAPSNGSNPFWIPGGQQYFQPPVDGGIIPKHQAEQFAIKHGIKRLADGGVTTGPTFALIGERGPEFIAPVKSLNSLGLTGQMGDINVIVTGLLSGNDITLSNSRTGRGQKRNF